MKAPPNSVRRRPVAPALGLAGLMALTAPLTGGCVFGPSERSFERSSERYSGPSVRFASIEGEHHAVLRSPTPGYAVLREGATDTLGSVDVFITVRRPNPAFQYPQQVVEQTIATGVPTTERARIFVRVLRHDTQESDRAYSLAATSPAIPAPASGGSSDTP